MLRLPDLCNGPVVEVVVDREAVKDDLDPGTVLLESFLEAAVHVHSDGSHMLHPIIAGQLDKRIHNFLLLAGMDEQNRIGIETNDVGCEFVSVVQLDLVNAKVLYIR